MGGIDVVVVAGVVVALMTRVSTPLLLHLALFSRQYRMAIILTAKKLNFEKKLVWSYVSLREKVMAAALPAQRSMAVPMLSRVAPMMKVS